MEPSFINVGRVMRREIHSVSGLASVREAIEEMARHGVSSLIIERRDENDEYGVISVSEIAARAVAKNKSLDRTDVYQIMDKPALTLSSEMNVKYAIRLLSQLGHKRALVTGTDGLIGYVTLRDMVLSYANVQPTET